MNKIEQLRNMLPNAVRDADYFNHIMVLQNDEIIRLLKKIAGEEEVKIAQPIPLVETVEEVPKKVKRTKKKEVSI